MLSPDGQVTPDFSESLPGRGAWVSANRKSIEKACSSGAFKRALRGEAKNTAGLADTVEAGLRKSALSALGMARRAGDVWAGFEKVKAALKAQKAAALVAASDSAPGGCEKLKAASSGAEIVDCFTRAELSAALGMDDLAFAALRSGPHTSRFLAAARRFGGFKKEA